MYSLDQLREYGAASEVCLYQAGKVAKGVTVLDACKCLASARRVVMCWHHPLPWLQMARRTRALCADRADVVFMRLRALLHPASRSRFSRVGLHGRLVVIPEASKLEQDCR